MDKLTTSSKLFLSAVALSGLAVLGTGAWKWACENYVRFLVFLLLTAIASALKVRLPGMTTTMSVNVPLILIALVELGFAQAVFIAAVSAAVQCLWKTRVKPQPYQVLFNICNNVNALGLASLVVARALAATPQTKIALIVGAAGIYFIASTIPVAIIIGLTEGKRPDRLWQDIFAWTFPYYVMSAGIAVTTVVITRNLGWQVPLVVVVLMFGVYRSYTRYFSQPQPELAGVGGLMAVPTDEPVEAAVGVAASTSGAGLSTVKGTPHRRL